MIRERVARESRGAISGSFPSPTRNFWLFSYFLLALGVLFIESNKETEMKTHTSLMQNLLSVPVRMRNRENNVTVCPTLLGALWAKCCSSLLSSLTLVFLQIFEQIFFFLSNRLRKVLPLILNEDQTCGVPSRSIFENLFLLRDTIALFTYNIYIGITMKLNTNARQFRAKMTK